MKSGRFAYFRPDSLDEAVDYLHTYEGEVRILAGGQSIVPLMNRRVVCPDAVVDVMRLHDLDYITCNGGILRIGALTRHLNMEDQQDPDIGSLFGVLQESARLVGNVPVRTRGTFGGSLAHADPRSEWCLIAVLLDAEIVVMGVNGSRVIDAGSFFTGTHCTVLQRDEIITEVRFPHSAPYATLTEFRIHHGDFALVTASASLDFDEYGTVIAAKIALGGVADRPIRVKRAENAIMGETPDIKLVKHVGRVVSSELDPPDDIRASGLYRREVASSLVTQALQTSIARYNSRAGNCVSKKAGIP